MSADRNGPGVVRGEAPRALHGVRVGKGPKERAAFVHYTSSGEVARSAAGVNRLLAAGWVVSRLVPGEVSRADGTAALHPPLLVLLAWNGEGDPPEIDG